MIDSTATQAPAAPPAASPPLPPTSLIIPSRGRPELLLATVQSILAGDEVPSELIVVDHSDNAQPALAALTTARDCRFRYEWSTERGVSRGRNQGIQLAQHEILVFVDDDVLVSRPWFGALVRALARSGPMNVVIGQIQPVAGETPDQFVPSAKTDQAPIVYAGRLDKDVLYTSNTALYRSALAQVGVFDERLGPGTGFNGSEDSDLGFRLLEAGYCIRYEPAALMFHRAWRGEADYLPTRWNYGVGRGAFYAKYFGSPDGHMRRRLRRDIQQHLLAALYYLLSDRRRALGDVALASGLVVGAARWRLARKPGGDTRHA